MSDNLSSNTNSTQPKILTKTSEYKEKLQKTLSLPTKDSQQTTHKIQKIKSSHN